MVCCIMIKCVLCDRGNNDKTAEIATVSRSTSTSECVYCYYAKTDAMQVRRRWMAMLEEMERCEARVEGEANGGNCIFLCTWRTDAAGRG